MNGDPLSPASRDAVSAARAQHLGVFVSPITAWEIGVLVSRNRISLSLFPSAWFDALLALPGVRLAAMSPLVLIASSELPGRPPKDPADRIIAATARTYGYDIVTRNGELTDYAGAGHIQVIGC